MNSPNSPVTESIYSLSERDCLYCLAIFSKYKNDVKKFSISDHEKIVCWKRAYYMFLSEMIPTASDLLVEKAGEPTFVSENNTTEKLSEEMILLVSIFWKLMTDLQPCWGTQTFDRFRNYVFDTSSFPFSADEMIHYCKQRLLQEKFTEVELRVFVENMIQEDSADCSVSACASPLSKK